MMASASDSWAGRLPRAGEQLPLFELPDAAGRTVRLWDFKQRRPVVLFFVHGAVCAACRDMLRGLAGRRAALEELRAAVLVVAPDPPERLAGPGGKPGAPFTRLSDPTGAVRTRYLPAGGRAVALYVADRYGECGLAAVADEATALPSADAVLAEIALADEGTCECTIPAWPEADESETESRSIG